MARRWSATGVARRTMTFAVGAAGALALGAQPAPAAELALLGQWRFDESDGQMAVDDGPHRLHGRLGGTNALEVADPVRIQGASGRALRFAGAASVSLPDSDVLAVQSLSAEAVVRAPGSPGPWRYLISRGGLDCTAGSYGLYTGAAGGLALYVFDGSRYLVSATAQPADVWNGAWHHVAGTFDGRALRLFVDGLPIGEPMDAPLRIDYARTSAHTAFGQYAGSCALGFGGDMDLVRLWSGALSPAAVSTAAAGSSAATFPAGPRPAAAPGTVIGATPGPPRPARACVVRLVRTSLASKRRTVVRVRVTVRRRPLRAARVVAHRSGRRKVIAKTRTNAKGRARLVLSAGRSRRVHISTPSRRTCASLRLRLPRS